MKCAFQSGIYTRGKYKEAAKQPKTMKQHANKQGYPN